MSGTLEPDPAGGTPMARVTLHDITERKRFEEQLRESYQRLQLATDAAGIGIWYFNFTDDSLEWDDRMCELFAVPAERRRAGITYELWRACIHPDDLALVDAVEGKLTNVRGPASAVYRIVLPGGGVRHIRANVLLESEPRRHAAPDHRHQSRHHRPGAL